MAVSTEARVGALAVVAITALVLGFDFLKGNNTFKKGRDYYVVYERVPGLQESDPIKVNDLLVGRVKELKLRADYSIVARLNISESFDIPKDTRAMISAVDFLGAKQVDLVIGKDPELARSGDTLMGTVEMGIQQAIREELQPITAKVQELMGSIDSSMTVVNAIFSGETGDDVTSSVTSIAEALENFNRVSMRIDRMVAKQAVNVDSIFTNLADVTGALAANDDQLGNIIGNMEAITDSLAAADFAGAVAEARDALSGLSSLVSAVNDGEGTLGKLIAEDGLYQDLNQTVQDLDKLVVDIEENPGRYVTLLRIGGGKRNKGD
jgi:phospholipid/cholesterol/gamma-HCH transport system substrate-binding protein